MRGTGSFPGAKRVPPGSPISLLRRKIASAFRNERRRLASIAVSRTGAQVFSATSSSVARNASRRARTVRLLCHRSRLGFGFDRRFHEFDNLSAPPLVFDFRESPDQPQQLCFFGHGSLLAPNVRLGAKTLKSTLNVTLMGLLFCGPRRRTSSAGCRCGGVQLSTPNGAQSPARQWCPARIVAAAAPRMNWRTAAYACALRAHLSEQTRARSACNSLPSGAFCCY